MNLLLDMGNSRTKWALEQNGSLFQLGVGDTTALLQAWQNLPKPDGILGCSVVSDEQQAAIATIARQLWALSVQWLQPELETLGVRNHYDATRLGPDRWAAVLGAHSLFPGKALVIVSAGTAQVVDALTAEGDFLGGSIQPGYQLMKRSLAGGTARLPLASGAFATFPVTTDGAIETGCLNALSGAIDAMVSNLLATGQPEVHVVLTGGDAWRIAPLLRNEVTMVDNLPLYGLAALAKSSVNNGVLTQ